MELQRLEFLFDLFGHDGVRGSLIPSWFASIVCKGRGW